MQACYVNTTHPDFLNGHKAMAIVTERLNANKPQHQEKPGKVTPAQLNNNRDLDVDAKEEPSFFGSFFSATSKTIQRKKAAPTTVASTMEAPPPVIKPQAAFNDRETMETEVISALRTNLCGEGGS